MPLPPSLTRQNAFYLEDDQINTPLDPVNICLGWVNDTY